MNIKIIKEKKWYSAILSEYGIFTQWDNFEELTANLKDALELYYQDSTNKKVHIDEFKEFNLVLN